MEEDACLRSLVQQQKERPQYSRVLSWEIRPLKPKRKKKNKLKQDIDRTDEILKSKKECSGSEKSDHFFTDSADDNSDNSGYISVDEYDIENDSTSETYHSHSSLDHSSKGISACNLGNNIGEILPETSIKNPCFCYPSKRKLTKRQKRRRRDNNKADDMYSDEISVLKIWDENRLEAEDAELSVMKRDFDVDKVVPSLVELCLKCSKSVVSGNDLVSKSLRTIYSNIHEDMTSTKKQLSWFFCILSWCFDPEPNSCYMFRNVWIADVYSKDSLLPKYNFSSLTACFGQFDFMFLVDSSKNYFMYEEFLEHSLKLPVYAATVDLMLPCYINNKSWQVSTAAKDRLKQALTKRFPCATDHLFDRALPYVYWARGQVQLATHHFIELSKRTDQSELEKQTKAFYLNEVARMHRHIGETELAARFYRMASDVLLGGGRVEKVTREVQGQIQMLLANLNDTGVLTKEKANKSVAHWKHIINSSDLFKEGCYREAVEAFLCYHGSNISGPSWLQQAADWLEDLTKGDNSLLYHTACVHAFMGDYSKARRIMKERGLKFPPKTTLPDHLSSLKASKEWGCLTCDQSEKSHMRVIWRTQLLPPLFNSPSKKKASVGDISNPDLNLRLSNHGYITGDFQLYLPPVRGVYLNPYTGYLAFPSVPGHTESWSYNQTFFDFSVSYNRGNQYGYSALLHVLTPVEVYSDNEGVKVHIILPGVKWMKLRINNFVNTETHSMKLIRKDVHGKPTKLNLFQKIQQFLYKEVKKEIEDLEFIEGKISKHFSDVEQYRRELISCLDMCFRNRWYLNLKALQTTLEYVKNDLKKSFHKDKPRYLRYLHEKRCAKPVIVPQENPVNFGKSLVLIFHYFRDGNQGTTFYNTIRVIINCSDEETFKNPVIEMFPPYLAGCGRTVTIDSESRRVPGAKIVCCKEIGKEKDFKKLLNEDGHEFDIIPSDYIKQTTPLFHVMGDTTIYIHESRERICMRKNGATTELPNFKGVKKIQVINATVCIVQEFSGICLYNMHNQKCLKFIVHIPNSMEREMLETDEHVIRLNGHKEFKILHTKRQIREKRGIINKIALVLETLFIVIEVPDEPSDIDEATITAAVHLPGYPTDCCFISVDAGFVVSWTHNKETEHLFYFSSDGKLQSILPFLGAGPFSFFSVFLEGDSKLEEKYTGHCTRGWYLYLKDGRGGILGVKLMDC